MCTNLPSAWIVPHSVVCRQGRRWANQSSSDNKEVSECAQTYRLHGLCHTELFAGKGGDGQINQVQTTKWSVSVHKLTFCIDCATGCCLQSRKKIKSISDNREVSECVQTYILHRLCHGMLFAGKEGDGQINQVQTRGQ